MKHKPSISEQRENNRSVFVRLFATVRRRNTKPVHAFVQKRVGARVLWMGPKPEEQIAVATGKVRKQHIHLSRVRDRTLSIAVSNLRPCRPLSPCQDSFLNNVPGTSGSLHTVGSQGETSHVFAFKPFSLRLTCETIQRESIPRSGEETSAM